MGVAWSLQVQIGRNACNPEVQPARAQILLPRAELGNLGLSLAVWPGSGPLGLHFIPTGMLWGGSLFSSCNCGTPAAQNNSSATEGWFAKKPELILSDCASYRHTTWGSDSNPQGSLVCVGEQTAKPVDLDLHIMSYGF